MRAFMVAFSLLALRTVTAPAAPVDPAADCEPTVVLVEPGTTYEELFGAQERVYGSTDLDPGVPPEGDYIGWIQFTRDGQRVLQTNRMTDNLTVYDWSTMSVLANIPLGRYPSGIAVTNDLAIVACSFAHAVYVIRLSDYSIVGVVPTGEQPWVLRASPDGRYVYVACDISNTCEKIDLETMTTVLTIPDFPIALLSFAFTSENGRNTVTFTDFELTPDGQHIAVSEWNDSVLFYNTTTGAIDHVVPGMPSCYSLALSGDGTKLIGVSGTNPARVHQIDLATHSRTATVSVTGKTIGLTFDAAVNMTGSKAFISVSGNQSAIVRFATNDFTLLSQTLSAFWVGVSRDHTKAISGQFNFSIVDFATETVLGQHSLNAQNVGAVSPVADHVASADPMRHEGVYFYSFTNPSPPTYRGTTNAGRDPEGDAPRRVAIATDGSKAVITNVLSDNATILNMSTYAVEAIVDIGDRVQDVEITSDSRWAVVCAFNTNSVKILDLTTNMVVADVPCGTRPGVVSITPNDQYAYIGDIQSNTVSVVRLNGAASARIAQFPVGTIGVVWAAYGVLSDVRVSPSGAYALVAVSFDDQVKVIDTATNAVVATLAVGDYPVQIAYNATGEYATVTNYFSHNISVIRVAGAASSVVGTFPRGQGPLRLAHNAVANEMGIGNYTAKTIARTHPETGALLGTMDYTAYGNIIQVRYDEHGTPLVLTVSATGPPGYLVRGAEAIPLPATPAYFDYNAASGRALVMMPGPDYATMVVLDPTGIEEAVTIPLDRPAWLAAPQPNPIETATRFGFALRQPGVVEIALVDLAGRHVATVGSGAYMAGTHSIDWSRGGIASGTYFAVLTLDGVRMDGRKVHILGRER